MLHSPNSLFLRRDREGRGMSVCFLLLFICFGGGGGGGAGDANLHPTLLLTSRSLQLVFVMKPSAVHSILLSLGIFNS